MQIKELLTSLHPKINDMPFMSELVSGKFEREEVLRSEVVELYRALDTRQKIQDILTKAAMDLAPIETIWQNQDKDPDEVDTIVQNLVKDTNKEEPKQEGTGM